MKNQKNFEKIGEIPKNVCNCLYRSLATCHWLRIGKNQRKSEKKSEKWRNSTECL
jgi:hypothetical protein